MSMSLLALASITTLYASSTRESEIETNGSREQNPFGKASHHTFPQRSLLSRETTWYETSYKTKEPRATQ
jgi:hypothetical protein